MLLHIFNLTLHHLPVEAHLEDTISPLGCESVFGGFDYLG